MTIPGEHRLIAWQSISQARADGWAVRDTIMVLGPDGLQAWALVRRPLDGTVAGTVLRHGHGGLNIEACRASWSGSKPSREACLGLIGKGFSRTISERYRTIFANDSDPVPSGRWPSNCVLLHASGCRSGPTPDTAWDCVPGCPVAHIAERSGERAGSYGGCNDAHGTMGYGIGRGNGQFRPGVPDHGTASRFFPRFASMAEVHAWFARLITP